MERREEEEEEETAEDTAQTAGRGGLSERGTVAVLEELAAGAEGDAEGTARARALVLWRELGEAIGAGEGTKRRRVRSDAGEARLTWRDLRALRLIGEQYAVTHEQLERLLALFSEDDVGGERERVNRRLAYRARTRWVRAGLVEARQVVAGEPPIIWLTARGRGLVELDVRSWRPTMNTIRHVPAVTEARLFLERRRPDGEWTAERLLAREAPSGGSSPSGRRPDGEFRYDGHVLAVEVELSAKKESRLKSIVRDRLERYDAVWYFAPAEPAHLRELIKRVAREVYGERLERAASFRRQGAGGERRERELERLEQRSVTLRALDGAKLWSVQEER